MYNVSNAYKAAVYNTPIYSKLAGTITLTNGETVNIVDNAASSNVVKGSVTIKNQCVAKTKLEYGCAYVGELVIALYNDIDANTLYNGVITLSWYLKTGANTYEEIPLGVYIIAEAVRTRQIVKITAYDKMQLLDLPFESTTTSGSVYEILTYISTITGITLDQTQEEIEALTNGVRYVTIDESMEYSTYRDIISDIATMLCCFATMSRAGALRFVPFATTTTEVMPKGRRNSTNIAEIVVNYDTIRLEGRRSTYTVVKTGQQTGTKLLNIGYCPVISQNHAVDNIKQALQNMIDYISALSYNPANCDIVANPALDLGDMIELTTGENTAVYMPLMSYVWKYHGSMQIKAVGDSTISGESRTQRLVTGTAEDIHKSETVIFTYENARELTINSDFKQIIRIDYVSMNATKGIFQAQILLTCTADATITCRYVINSSLDADFQPQQDVKAGKHIITLIYPLNAIPQNTANSLRVQMNISAGSATIEEFNIKAALSAQGLDTNAVEWDGTLEIEEEFTPFTLAGITVTPLNESVTAAVDTPTAGTVTQIFAPFTLAGITLAGLNDNVSVDLTDA